MDNRRSLVRSVSFLTILGLILVGSVVAKAVVAPSVSPALQRADVINIDTLQQFGALERPAVQFLHDKHTEAVEKLGKDCTACHLPEQDKNRLSIKYMRLKDTSKKQVMDIYHTNCVACHRENQSSKPKSGPVTCGGCHRKSTDIVSIGLPFGFDKSLHYRHSKALDKKCELCHHEYNAETKKLYYAKGKEGTCRYCHKSETEENRISNRLASHQACLSCHRDTIAKNKSSGPLNCSGCHDPNERKMIERISPVPRMQMKQPDVVLVKNKPSESQTVSNPGLPLQRTNRVPFSHASHEQYSDTCRVCHHADLTTCVKCHTQSGTKEGNFINLGRAMHRANVDTSCVGCHEMQKRDKACVGCHASIKPVDQQSQAACKACHLGPTPDSATSMTADEEKVAAETLLAARRPIKETYADEDVPDKVIIKVLSNEYKPVELPHRKIVRTLARNIRDSKLANYFHADEGTMCQSCHHHSPASKKPPQCASCHGKPFDPQKPLMPGLMAAYHRQCMECHARMGIEKPVATDCTGCHQKR